jgi:Flp pilus assembly protein TadB
MNSSNDIDQPLTAEPTRAELGEDLFEVTGGGVRVIEVGLVILLGLLVCPPLLILAVVVAVPAIAISAVVAAVAAAIVLPTLLVRRVRAHHREHGSTLFLHRLRPR